MLLSLILMRLWQSTGCVNYLPIKFDPQKIVINVETQRLYDENPNGLISKAVHNKLTATTHEFLLALAKTFDPSYLLSLIGPLGIVSGSYSIYLILKNRQKKATFFLLFVICAHILSILYLNPKTAMLILDFLWFLLSLWSIHYFIKEKRRVLFFIVLWLFSVWFFFINWQLPQICNEIIFK